MKSNKKPKRESGSQKNLPWFMERNPSKTKGTLPPAARTFGPTTAPVLKNFDGMTPVKRTDDWTPMLPLWKKWR